MRVLHVAPNIARGYGGPTQALLGYAQAARRAGVEVSIAAPRPSREDESWFADSLTGGELHLFQGYGAGAFAASPSLHRWLRREVGGYDLVHVHGLLNSVSSLAARNCIRRRRAVIIRPFGTLSRYTFAHRRAGLKRGYFRLLDGPNLLHAAGVHFTTAGEREESRWHGIDFDGRSYVVPPPFLGSVRARPAERHHPAEPTVVCISRLNPVKHLELLIDAWPQVAAARPAARLVLAGDGEPPYVESLRLRATQRGVSGRVVFAGFVSGAEKATLLDRADLFVLPSYHENFGMSVVEALAVGVPVVVTREVHLSPFVEEHRLGAVVERDPDALARVILQSLGDDALRSRCRVAGAALVSDNFSSGRVGALLCGMYRSVLAAWTH